FIFFSSRRRHTRSKRDWSSDVCSSDLLMHYHNEKADHWLEQAMLETENEKRQQIYQQVLDTLTTDAVILPIYHYYLPVKIAADIAGYDLNNPTQIFYSKDLYRSVQ